MMGYCPAFMSLSYNLVEPITHQLVFSEAVPFFKFTPGPIPDPFIASIFHPPLLAYACSDTADILLPGAHSQVRRLPLGSLEN